MTVTITRETVPLPTTDDRDALEIVGDDILKGAVKPQALRKASSRNDGGLIRRSHDARAWTMSGAVD